MKKFLTYIFGILSNVFFNILTLFLAIFCLMYLPVHWFTFFVYPKRNTKFELWLCKKLDIYQ